MHGHVFAPSRTNCCAFTRRTYRHFASITSGGALARRLSETLLTDLRPGLGFEFGRKIPVTVEFRSRPERLWGQADSSFARPRRSPHAPVCIRMGIVFKVQSTLPKSKAPTGFSGTAPGMSNPAERILRSCVTLQSSRSMEGPLTTT